MQNGFASDHVRDCIILLTHQVKCKITNNRLLSRFLCTVEGQRSRDSTQLNPVPTVFSHVKREGIDNNTYIIYGEGDAVPKISNYRVEVRMSRKRQKKSLVEQIAELSTPKPALFHPEEEEEAGTETTAKVPTVCIAVQQQL